MEYDPYYPNQDINNKLQKIVENTRYNPLAGSGQSGAINVTADVNLEIASVSNRNTVEEIVTQHDANISEMYAKAELSDRQIRDALGTESSEGGYLNQLIEIADGAGATIVTSTGSTLSIGPKRNKD